MEIEATYTITGTLTPLDINRINVQPYTLHRAADHDLHDTVMDTPERTLSTHHSSLRIRHDGPKTRITLKSSTEMGAANGIHRREEIEHELASDAETDIARWPNDIAQRFYAIAGETAHPAPLFTIHNNRRTWQVLRADGTEVAEVALDTGTFEARCRKHAFHEIEIELKGDGNEDDLHGIMQKFTAALPALHAEERSKFQRGLAFLDQQNAKRRSKPGSGAQLPMEAAVDLLPTHSLVDHTNPLNGAGVHVAPHGRHPSNGTGIPPLFTDTVTNAPFVATTVSATESVTVTPEPQPRDQQKKTTKPQKDTVKKDGRMTANAPLAEAGRAVLKKHLASLRKAEPVARAGKDPEGVHAMRVATRRLRAALSVLEETVYDPKITRRFRRDLRELAATLGTVRDADVFLLHIDQYAATQTESVASGLDPLRVWVRHTRDIGRKAMLAVLRTRKTRQLLKDLTDFVHTEGAGVRLSKVAENEVAPSLVRHFAGSALWQQYETVIAYETAMPAPIQTIHRLRVAGKHMRYTLEFFKEALGGNIGTVMAEVTAMQDVLGQLHDDEVAMIAIDSILAPHNHKKSKKSHTDEFSVAERNALKTYRRARQSHQDEGTNAFLANQWPAISGTTLRHQLSDVLAHL